jgi:hypothetical protein
MRRHSHISIDAPAARVWAINGDGFDRIGEWATAIDASHSLAADEDRVDAPITGRICEAPASTIRPPNLTSRTRAGRRTGPPI